MKEEPFTAAADALDVLSHLKPGFTRNIVLHDCLLQTNQNLLGIEKKYKTNKKNIETIQNNEKNLKEINDWAKTHSKLIGRDLKTYKYTKIENIQKENTNYGTGI